MAQSPEEMAAAMIADFMEVKIPEKLTHLRRWDERVRGRPSWDA